MLQPLLFRGRGTCSMALECAPPAPQTILSLSGPRTDPRRDYFYFGCPKNLGGNSKPDKCFCSRPVDAGWGNPRLHEGQGKRGKNSLVFTKDPPPQKEERARAVQTSTASSPPVLEVCEQEASCSGEASCHRNAGEMGTRCLANPALARP